MTKVLITGVTGFAGSFLAEYLSKTTESLLIGTCLTRNNLGNIAEIKEKVEAQAAEVAVEKTKPETEVAAQENSEKSEEAKS